MQVFWTTENRSKGTCNLSSPAWAIVAEIPPAPSIWRRGPDIPPDAVLTVNHHVVRAQLAQIRQGRPEKSFSGDGPAARNNS